jgi:hypothetical protein
MPIIYILNMCFIHLREHNVLTLEGSISQVCVWKCLFIASTVQTV